MNSKKGGCLIAIPLPFIRQGGKSMEKRDFYFGLGFVTFILELALKTFVPYGGNDDKLFKICMIASVCMMIYKIVPAIFNYIERRRKDSSLNKKRSK